MTTVSSPIARDPKQLFDQLRRRRTVRRWWLAAILTPTVLAAGWLAWKVGGHVIAATRLEASSFVVTWRFDRANWRQGGLTTAEVTPNLFGFVGEARAVNNLRPLVWLHRVDRVDLSKLDGLRDEELEPLADLTALVALNLDQRYAHNWFSRRLERPTDVTVARLRSLTRLRDLNLAGTRITDAALPHLAGLADLEILDLGDTEITDAGLEPLKALKRLKYVNLHGTRVTLAGARGLKAALPETEVDVEAGTPSPR